MRKVIVKDGGVMALPGKMTTHSWELPYGISYDEWRSAGLRLGQIKDWTNFAIGDWMAHGEAKWGERYTQAVSELDISEERLRQMKWVASRILPQYRNNNLSWSHHYAVASLDDEQNRRHWLTRAENNAWQVRELQDELVKAGLREQRERRPALRFDPELTAISVGQPTNGVITAVVDDRQVGPTCRVCDEAPATVLVCPKCVESVHLAFEQIRSKNIHRRKGKKNGTRQDRDAAGSDERQDH